MSVAYEVIRHPRRGLTMRRGRRTAAEFDAAAVDEYARVMGLHLTPEELRIRQRRAAGRSINCSSRSIGRRGRPGRST